MKHEHRVPYVRAVATAPIRTVSVLIHKPSITEPEKFQSEAFRLYRYATRVLVEARTESMAHLASFLPQADV